MQYIPGTGLSHPLPDRIVELAARRFQLLGEPIRIRLLERLRDGEAPVHELVEATGVGQQNASKHLLALLRGGIVARRKQGTSVHYSIADEATFKLCDDVCESIERQLAELEGLFAESRR